MITHFWLWVYPKNTSMFATRFKIGERFCQGEPIWIWVRRIMALKAKKMVWDVNVEARPGELGNLCNFNQQHGFEIAGTEASDIATRQQGLLQENEPWSSKV
jgi:hypothetical protein